MNNKVKSFVTKTKSSFSGFTAGQRAVTIIAIIVAIIGGIVFVQWASRPTMAPLFTNLSSSDAGAITAKLTERGTQYELADAGSTVLVPRPEVDQARIDLAGEGLPAGSKDSQGYNLLDNEGIASSDFQQKMTAKRATEGELKKAIEKMDPIQEATVQLALPEEEVFTAEQAPTTASVLVATKPSQSVSAGQVEAIVHLVSSSVPKLAANQVTVTDNTGKLLSASGMAGAASSVNDARVAQAQTISAAASQKIQAMLDKAVGVGNSTVTVQADLNFDNTQVKTNEYIPAQQGAVPVQEDSSNETLKGSGQTPVGGVLGPDNITVPNANSGQSNQDYEKATTRVTNPVGTRQTVTEQAPGRLQRLNVAVMLDATKARAVTEAQVQTIVAAAAGIDTTRGDVIAVSKIPFDRAAAQEAEAKAKALEEQKKQDELIELAKNIGLALLLLLALLIGFRKSRKTQTKTIELGELPSMGQPETPGRPGGSMAELPPSPAEYALEDDELPVLEAIPVDPQSEARANAREEISALVEESPDEVARLLRGWISDRK
ncbi:flagellar basal-body MS-ring/collar protein FliF [Gephyromycinifex aptenodytis]|uniref:flagellar basal-body MS-ring/collar protein FliF n=1 Tax=Gephyromycinifex aptenodytis TaxID=2716227 RepID=UPI0014488FB7|nr:flagellar basal-body MS-ring/collar protein FliF [Gephyromycinifex aptenodytis]